MNHRATVNHGGQERVADAPASAVRPDPAAGHQHGPRSLVILILAVSSALCVANLYYIQPILPSMAASLHVPAAWLTPAVSSTQAGYALGLCTLVPLGDVLDRKRLLTVLMSATAVVLTILPTTSGIALFVLFFLLGLVTVSAMVMVPLAANLARPEQRGQVVGTVMTGLILGTLLCRTFAGSLAQVAGWRSVYWVAAGITLAAMVVLRRILPATPAGGRIGPRDYGRLIFSLAGIVRRNRVLVERALYGALGFATFNVLWTSVPLRLTQAPYHYQSAAIGAMGLLGAGGALGASLAGKLADRGRQILVTAAAFTIIAASFVVLTGYSGAFVVLALTILLIDFAVQSAHITNQATVFANADASVRSRVTTAYMTTYFIGGAAGSAATGFAWSHSGWTAIPLIGAGTALGALLLLLGYQIHRWRQAARYRCEPGGTPP